MDFTSLTNYLNMLKENKQNPTTAMNAPIPNTVNAPVQPPANNPLNSFISNLFNGGMQPAVNKPQNQILGMPGNDFARILGTTAAAISPHTFGGRLGMGAVGLVNQQEDAARDREIMDMQKMKFGLDMAKTMQEWQQEENARKQRESYMADLNRVPATFSSDLSTIPPDIGVRVAPEIPKSAMAKMSPVERAAFGMESMSKNPNFAPFLKTQEPPKISGHMTVDSQGNPIYLNEFGKNTGIPAYVKPSDVEPYKVGTVRAFDVGDRKVYKQYMGDGEWQDMQGLGGARWKAATGGKGGGVSNKDALKYQKNVEAYKREIASLDDMYNQNISQPDYIGNSRGAILNRNAATDNYKKELDKIVRKYRGKIDFVGSGGGATSAPSSQGTAKTWTSGGKTYRVDPVTGKTQMYVEDGS